MNKKVSFYIIAIPIFFVWFSIAILTYQYINNNNTFIDNEVKNFSNKFIIKQKTDIYNKIYYFKNIIDILEKKFYDNKYSDLEKHNFLIKKAITLKPLNNQYTKTLIPILNNEGDEVLVYSLKDSKMIFNSFKIDNNDLNKLLNANTNRIVIEQNRIKYIYYKSEIRDDGIIILSRKNKNILEEQLKKEILVNISEFYIENSSYFFVLKMIADDKYKVKVLLHQSRPQLEGRTLDINDKYYDFSSFNKSFFELLAKDKEGFITYTFQKPESSEVSKKMSYLYTYEKWGWVLATGFYFDDLENEIKKFENNIRNKVENSLKDVIFYAVLITFIVTIVLYFIAVKIIRFVNIYANNLKDTNNSLTKQSSVLKSLFDKSIDGIILINKHGLVVNCNESFINMLDFKDNSNILNKKLCELSPKSQIDNDCLKKESQILEIISNKNKYSFEWLFKKRDNSLISCEVRTTKLKIDNEDITHAVVRDITHSKKIEEIAQKQQVLLAEESKKAALGEMLTMIAHQWRQPLNNINLLVHFIRDGFKKKLITIEQIEDMTKDMKSQIDYLSSTINDFTNFSNPYKEKANFCINDMVDKTLIICTAQVEKNDISIVKDIKKVFIYGVENELMQVLLNLINNSKDAFIEKDISKRYIFIESYQNKKEVVLIVKDNAGGINEDIITRVFEPYFTTKHKSNGTGIGLYMCQEIVSQYKDGKIEVSNEMFTHEDKSFVGATFKITFTLD